MWFEAFCFAEVLPRSDKHDRFLAQLQTPAWRIALAALYLSSGRFLPDEAAQRGVYYGFCNAAGDRCPMEQATHVGWSIVPPDAPETRRGQ